jgi:uncharacterized protein
VIAARRAGRRGTRGHRTLADIEGDAALKLDVLDGDLAVARLGAGEPVPEWAEGGAIGAVVRSADELTVVCPSANVPDGVRRESGFRALFVRGPLDFGMTGVISGLSAPLARAGVPIFVLSTFDTDYLLVREHQLKQASRALREAGH